MSIQKFLNICTHFSIYLSISRNKNLLEFWLGLVFFISNSDYLLLVYRHNLFFPSLSKLTSLISCGRLLYILLDALHILSCRLQWSHFYFFSIRWLLYIFLALLHWLEYMVPCWIETSRTGSLFLFLTL